MLKWMPMKHSAASLQWSGALPFTLLMDGVKAASPAHRGRLLLDVGCGSKPFELQLRRPGDTWIGVDMPAPPSGLSRADVNGSALQLPFASETFDIVLCTQVLEHVPEPWTAMVEMARILEPRGYLIATAPHISVLHEEPYDFFRFTCYGLQQLAARAGFTPLMVEPLGGFCATLGYLLICRGSALLRIPLFGQALTRWTSATIGWAALQGDALERRISPRPPKEALIYLLVAQKA